MGFTEECGWAILLEKLNVSVFRSFLIPCSPWESPASVLLTGTGRVATFGKPSEEEGWRLQRLRCKYLLFPACSVLFSLSLVVPCIPWTQSPPLPVQRANEPLNHAVDSTASSFILIN